MKFGSLFAGIGGFDLGLERAGMSCQWQVEIEEYPTKILEKHWPEVHRERDIKECSGSNLEDVDLICGGFPCQDISVAGAGAGLAGERSGLWYEMHRIIGDIKPRWVIVENVAALLSRGMDVVLRDLSQIGYDCEWHVISASAIGAPHRRERVWIIANANNAGNRALRNGTDSDRTKEKQIRKQQSQLESSRCSENVPNANGKRLEGKRANDYTQGRKEERGQAGLCNGEELRRYASWWEAESGIQPLAHGVPERMARLKAIGNAVVPQVVELIGRRIMEIEGNLN